MLWGRDTQLEILKRLLGERIPSAHTTRLYSIEGESGMGKTALLSELLAFLKTLPRPMIIVEAAGWANIPDEQMEEFLAGCVRTRVLPARIFLRSFQPIHSCRYLAILDYSSLGGGIFRAVRHNNSRCYVF